MVETLSDNIAQDSSSKIQCLVCGHGYHVLSSHLSAHDLSSSGYREKFGLPENSPLQSKRYISMMMAFATRPEQLMRSRSLPTDWNKGYRISIEKLAEAGLLVPSIASRQTGIPLTSLYDAMQLDTLPFTEASVLVCLGEGDNLRLIGSKQPVKLISSSDLADYASRHKFLRIKGDNDLESSWK